MFLSTCVFIFTCMCESHVFGGNIVLATRDVWSLLIPIRVNCAVVVAQQNVHCVRVACFPFPRSCVACARDCVLLTPRKCHVRSMCWCVCFGISLWTCTCRFRCRCFFLCGACVCVFDSVFFMFFASSIACILRGVKLINETVIIVVLTSSHWSVRENQIFGPVQN